MQCLRHQNNSGFTLVEMLIVAPIIILVIAGMIALMITMTGDVLISQARSQQIADNQQGISQIESDVRTAVTFPASFLAPSPFGPNNTSGTWNANTTNTIQNNTTNALIISTYATSTNPMRTSYLNSLFYLNNVPNSCASTNRVYNNAYMVNIIYFISNNTLYRRVYLPPISGNSPNAAAGNASQNICDFNNDSNSPWQQASCTASYVGQGGCATADNTVATNVSSLTANYFSDTSALTPLSPGSQLSAQSVGLSLASSTMVAGRTINYTSNLTALSANSYMGQ